MAGCASGLCIIPKFTTMYMMTLNSFKSLSDPWVSRPEKNHEIFEFENLCFPKPSM